MYFVSKHELMCLERCMIDKKKMFWKEKQTNHHKSTKCVLAVKVFLIFSKMTFFFRKQRSFNCLMNIVTSMNYIKNLVTINYHVAKLKYE